MPTLSSTSEDTYSAIGADISRFAKVTKFDPSEDDRDDEKRAKFLAFKSALLAMDPTDSLRRAIHNAESTDPPTATDQSRQDDLFLHRVLCITTQGEAALYLISEDTGRGSWTTLQRVFARFDISSLLKELEGLKFNNYANVHLFRANVNALHKQYLALGQNVPQILTRALRNALKPPNAPRGFESLLDRWLAAEDSLTIEDALRQLDI